MLGAICGDILGSGYEYEEKKYENPESIKLCTERDTFTDDTAMTLAVADWLLNDIDKYYYDDDMLKEALGKQFLKYANHTFKDDEGNLGFGGSFWTWCAKADLIQDFSPYQSYGNGSGMRVSPVGWFFDTMEETMRFAKLSADVTHDHPEGEKGAMCIAAAIFLARKGDNSKKEIKEYLLRAFGYEFLNISLSELRQECAWSEICQDTVPMAVVAFLESFDYESAVKNAISYGSDSDTIADMAGAIAEAFYKHIPKRICEFCLSKIPSEQQSLINRFYDVYKRKDTLRDDVFLPFFKL